MTTAKIAAPSSPAEVEQPSPDAGSTHGPAPASGEPSDWRDDAACKGADTAIFFPTRGQSLAPAKAYCDRCPVKAECLAASFTNGSGDDLEIGVWGGRGLRSRRTLRIAAEGRRPRGSKNKPINHGTSGGYRAHHRRGEEACDLCKAAATERRQRQKRGAA